MYISLFVAKYALLTIFCGISDHVVFERSWARVLYFCIFIVNDVWWRIYTLYDICRNCSDRVCVFSVCECCAKIAVSTSLNYEPDRIGVPAGCCTPSCKCISVRVYFFFYIGLILICLWPEQLDIDSMSFFSCCRITALTHLWPSNVMWRQRYLGQHWMR